MTLPQRSYLIAASIFSLLILLALAALSLPPNRRVTGVDFNKVEEGMSLAEVEKLFRQRPTRAIRVPLGGTPATRAEWIGEVTGKDVLFVIWYSGQPGQERVFARMRQPVVEPPPLLDRIRNWFAGMV